VRGGSRQRKGPSFSRSSATPEGRRRCRARFDPERIESFLALLPPDSDAASAFGSSRPLRHATEVRHGGFVALEFVALLQRRQHRQDRGAAYARRLADKLGVGRVTRHRAAENSTLRFDM
jgi:hypothetical protein